MDNIIFEHMLSVYGGNYVHALEVSSASELESCIEQLCDELLRQFEANDILDFVTSLSIMVYECDDESENEIYDFNVYAYTCEKLGIDYENE